MEETISDGGLLHVRSNGNRRLGTLMFLSLSCVTASAAFVAVEFGGWIKTGNELGYRTGARVTGYFTYESEHPSGPQTASRPNFVFEIPEHQVRFERSSYGLYVYNDRLPGDVSGDGVRLEFGYPYGFGALFLNSSNISLFPNNLTPPTIPALEQFDAGRTLYVISHLILQRGMHVQIDQLSVVPGSGLGRPVIFGLERTAGAVNFRFLTEPSTAYAVQVTDNLPAMNWVTLTNIGPTTKPTVVINDAAAGLEKRFYRIAKTTN